MFWVIFVKEMKMMVTSRRFLYSLILLFLPVAVGAWFCHAMWLDPSILLRMTGGWLIPVTPKVCLMVFLDVAPLPVALTAIVFSSSFVAGEEERGTLLLLLSKPLSRMEIILAKYFSFLLILLSLVSLNLLFFNLSLRILGIGVTEMKVFLSYLLALFCVGVVYTSLGTLFSVAAGRTLSAILTGFLLLITWFLFDWIISYLPYSMISILEKFSLSYYINRIIGYTSQGEAVLFLGGGVPEVFSFMDLFVGLFAVLGILSALPLGLSIIIFNKKDIQGP